MELAKCNCCGDRLVLRVRGFDGDPVLPRTFLKEPICPVVKSHHDLGDDIRITLAALLDEGIASADGRYSIPQTNTKPGCIAEE